MVQGVGFRPFVYRIAAGLGLSGFVRNQSGTVYLEVEGPASVLDRFAQQLVQEAPPLARLDGVSWHILSPTGMSGFQIVESLADTDPEVFVSPDVATCVECLAELFDPRDRRFRYPFLNCTNCGPRLTIVQGAPYDRQRTTMAPFPMCADCRREYADPTDRRFHAQPIACPACGPQLRLLAGNGDLIGTVDPLYSFAEAIREGKIGALKGLGGYHLVCDATAEPVVAELRRRKYRDSKPFALMVGSLEDAQRLCVVDAAERTRLCSPQRPIVLLRVRTGGTEIAPSVAPGNPLLGVMLPYTPLHQLLLEALPGRPLVMTSGNRADEPMACDDTDAIQRLGGIVDRILTHNRPIQVRCDDSVTRIIPGQELLIRRSRGYAPAPLALPQALPVGTLAVGGQLKSTFALGRDRIAFLSHHLGDLDHLSACRAFERDISLYEDLFAVRPQLLVHDLHPDYASTRYAQSRAGKEGLRLLAVQHHHAHIASCLAEHGLSGPVIGVAFDGSGYGADGAIWGGEFLVADYAEFRRAGHLRYVGLPGGEAAVREPWRMAAAYLIDAGLDLSLLAGTIPAHALRTIERMVTRRLQTPLTSSMGRLFDAVAALLGFRTRVSYEGQAAMELEWLAAEAAPGLSYPFVLREDTPSAAGRPLEIDTRPLLRALVDDVSAGTDRKIIARRFHSTILDIVEAVCRRLRRDWKLEQVALSGGTFMNAILAHETAQRLTADGFEVFRQQVVPCNDGGLALGQLAVAAARSAQEFEEG